MCISKGRYWSTCVCRVDLHKDCKHLPITNCSRCMQSNVICYESITENQAATYYCAPSYAYAYVYIYMRKQKRQEKPNKYQSIVFFLFQTTSLGIYWTFRPAIQGCAVQRRLSSGCRIVIVGLAVHDGLDPCGHFCVARASKVHLAHRVGCAVRLVAFFGLFGNGLWLG